jgi:hypothetical protein
MVIRKTSRVINMNYDYQIINEEQILKVAELKRGNKVGYCWKIEHLKKDYTFTSFILNEDSINSFNRTQNWLIENHPEYMI